MSFESRITKSYDGRRFGLQIPSSVETGSSVSQAYLAGPEALRQNVSSAESTSVNLKAFGVSYLSTVSSGVHTLDPPIPGVEKWIINGSSGATEFVKTRNNETIQTSKGSTWTTLRLLNPVVLRLVGITTAAWACAVTTAAGVGMTTTT